MSEMLERVARAIALAALDPETRAAVNPDKWFVAESYYDLARAAIEVMREPTDAMKSAPYDAEIDFGPGGTGDIEANPLNVWQAMIDAALKQEEKA